MKNAYFVTRYADDNGSYSVAHKIDDSFYRGPFPTAFQAEKCAMDYNRLDDEFGGDDLAMYEHDNR